MTTKEPIIFPDQLAARLQQLPGWSTENGCIRHRFKTDGWRSTMLLVGAIAFVAEAANHHPDLEVHWGEVVVRLHTHSAGGITEKDVQLAAQINAVTLWQPEGTFPGLAGQASKWIEG